MRVLIFANPIAGRGRGRDIAADLSARLSRLGMTVRVFLDRVDLIDPAALLVDETSAVIVIGGDGTIRAVAAFLIRTFPAGNPPPILIVPLGTANLLAQHFHIDWQPGQIEAALQQRKLASLDVATANYDIFLLMAGAGIDAAIVHALHEVRTGPINKLSYFQPALATLRDYSYPPITVEADGQTVFHDAPAIAMIANIAEYGTGFPIVPQAVGDDGLLDLCVLPCRSRDALLKLTLRAAAGELARVEGVVIRRAKEIRITATTAIPVQLDGDSAGQTPLHIRLLPHRLGFIVP